MRGMRLHWIVVVAAAAAGCTTYEGGGAFVSQGTMPADRREPPASLQGMAPHASVSFAQEDAGWRAYVRMRIANDGPQTMTVDCAGAMLVDDEDTSYSPTAPAQPAKVAPGTERTVEWVFPLRKGEPGRIGFLELRWTVTPKGADPAKLVTRFDRRYPSPPPAPPPAPFGALPVPAAPAG